MDVNGCEWMIYVCIYTYIYIHIYCKWQQLSEDLDVIGYVETLLTLSPFPHTKQRQLICFAPELEDVSEPFRSGRSFGFRIQRSGCPDPMVTLSPVPMASRMSKKPLPTTYPKGSPEPDI